MYIFIVTNSIGNLFSGAAQAVSYAAYGQGTGRITLDDVSCTGSENRLADCSHRYWLQHNCVHAEDASVICNEEGNIISSALIKTKHFCKCTCEMS